jgi:hypothetical protein
VFVPASDSTPEFLSCQLGFGLGQRFGVSEALELGMVGLGLLVVVFFVAFHWFFWFAISETTQMVYNITYLFVNTK